MPCRGVGSALEALFLTPWTSWREIFLLKRIDEAKLRRIRDRLSGRSFWPSMVPAMLPRPAV